jgi:hypothetical protein
MEGKEHPMSLLSYKPTGLEAIENNGPRILFAEHHLSLRRAGEDLMARGYEDDCHELVAQYRIFEAQILEHMRAEEELVLPAYAQAWPEEAATIRAEHAALRKQLERTALDIELHAVRLDAIRALLATLEAHAKYEDRTMYPWAQIHLPDTSKSTIAARLLASLRKLAKLA